MEASTVAPAPQTESREEPRESLRAGLAATVVLLTLMVVPAVPVVRLALVELDPLQALVEGLRLPAGLPRLGVPFGQHAVTGYWVAETVGALVVLVVFWARYLSARQRPARGRLRVLGQVWLDTMLAALVGCLVQSVVVSFLTDDVAVPYLLMIGGTVLFALLVGFAAGLLPGIPAALAHRRV